MTLTEWEAASWVFLADAMGIAWRSSALAVVCGCAAWLLRSRTAGLRFSLWRWILFALLALPLLVRVTPPLFHAPRIGTRVSDPAPRPTVGVVAGERRVTAARTRITSDRTSSKRSQAWILLLPGLYLLVTTILLARLGYNLICLRRLAGRSEFISDAAFRELSHEVWLESGVRG